MKKLFGTFFCALLLAFLYVPSANAGSISIVISDGSASQTITLSGGAKTSSFSITSATGTWNGSIVAYSTQDPGEAPLVHFEVVAISSLTSQSILNVFLSQSDFSTPIDALSLWGSATTKGQVSLDTYSNGTMAIPTLGPFTSSLPTQMTVGGDVSLDGDYSLGIDVIITHQKGNKSTTVKSELTSFVAVPEPSIVVLLGLGILGAGMAKKWM
jgi:hypothetical protein